MPDSHPVIVVCISGHPKTGVLLREGWRKAREMGGRWITLFVETPAHYNAGRQLQNNILRFTSQAEEMGAEVIRLQAISAADGILQFIRQSRKSEIPITHVLLGRVEKTGFFQRVKFAIADLISQALAVEAPAIKVEALPLRSEEYNPTWRQRISFRDVQIKEIALAIIAVAIAQSSTELLRIILPETTFLVNKHNVSLLFLIACMFTAGRYGLVPGLVASFSSFVALHYFYIDPGVTWRTFSMPSFPDLVNLALFLGTAVIVSLFSSYTHAHAEAAAQRDKRTQALFNISRSLNLSTTRNQALRLLYSELSEFLEMEVAFFLTSGRSREGWDEMYPKDARLGSRARAALMLCWTQRKTTGFGTIRHPESLWRFEPIITGGRLRGVLGVKIPRKARLDISFGRLLSALSDLSGAILDRIDLTESMEHTRINEEKEKLRSTLLSSVSHDLKTPLSSIIGSLNIFHAMYDTLPEDRRLALTRTAQEEAERLENFIANILGMTRIESGDVIFKKEWHDPESLVRRVKKRLADRLRHHTLVIHPLAQKIEIEIDPTTFEQVIQNLLDNAAKYAPANTSIEISMEMAGNQFQLSVRDHGAGIPDHMQEAVFNKYTRLEKKDSQVAGTGLGLAICKAVIEAQGGKITVANHPDGGAVFTLILPNIRLIDNEEISAETARLT